MESKTNYRSPEAINLPYQTLSSTRKVPYQLLQKITDSLSDERKLGSGAFGTVYKGVHENGETIAVKVLRYVIDIDSKQFQNEFQNLAKLKHRNVVELVGYCNETEQVLVEHQGKRVIADQIHMALCMEYIDNGSLSEHIDDEQNGLSWHIRYGIIKGICEGLQYLHEGSENCILHLDLKPDNILLDKNMVPKIADFGLSRLYGDDDGITQITMSSLGTRGYLPPEYIDHQIVSKAFDIYSLGVIITKIMVGHEGYKNIDMDKQKFAENVHNNWRKRLQEMRSHTSSLEVFCQQVKACIEIALKCLKQDRRDRPNIQEIMFHLNKVETVLGGVPTHVEQHCDGESIPSMVSITSGTYSSERTSNDADDPTARPNKILFNLLERITDGFSKERLLFQYGYEQIYKGIYEDGKAIAVKLPSHDWIKLTDKEFEAEALKHINIQHQNIVKCVGYSTTKSQNQTSEIDKGRFVITETSARALCFEYHKNIRLDRLIQERFYIVDWETRYRIIKGICEGLRYLQEGWAADIYMVDLEPSRIFVDESMVARIDVQRPGYHNDHLPPEYKSQGLTLKRTDTYSFGVIIMQTMAFYEDYLNRVEETSEEFIELVLCKCKSMQQGTVGHTLSKLYLQQMRRCIQIALACVDHHSSSRPSITEIIDMLNETETRILKQLQTLDVAPLQLCFMFEPPRKYVSCSLQLTNYGGHRIAFRLVSHSSPTKKFFTKLPLYGVVPPKCTYTLTLTMRKWPQQAPLKDEAFTLQSVPVQDQDLQDLDILDQESIITEYNKYFDNDQQVTHEEVRQLTLKAVSNPQTEEATNFTVATCVWKHVIMYLRCLQRVAVKSRPKSLYCLHKQAEHIPRVIWQPREHAIEIIASLKAQQALSIEVHPTGPWIMTTHHDGSLHVWNYKTMVPLEAFNFTDEPVYTARFVAREKWIVAGDGNGCIHVYNYMTNQDVKSLEAHNGRISSLAVHPTNPYVLSASHNDHMIKLWDWEDWACTRIFEGHSDRVTQVTLNPLDAGSFASASYDGTVKIWSLHSDVDNFVTFTPDEHPEDLVSVDYFPCGSRQNLITRSKHGTALIWDTTKNRGVQKLDGHAHHLNSIYCHPELPKVITGSQDGTVRIWDSFTYRLETIIDLNLGKVCAFGYISGLRRIIVGCHQGMATVDINLPRRPTRKIISDDKNVSFL